jgi:hypothetical protein
VGLQPRGEAPEAILRVLFAVARSIIGGEGVTRFRIDVELGLLRGSTSTLQRASKLLDGASHVVLFTRNRF